MNFLSLSFYAFLPIFFILYYLIPKKYRYVVIFLGSYFFYGFADPKLLLILCGITLITYVGGLLVEKHHSVHLMRLFFGLDIAVLLFFKYTDFALQNINLIRTRLLDASTEFAAPSLFLPVGLSFIVFQSVTYLVDVYKGNLKAEHNIICFASFVAFFPTILSGPIQKARNLIPQIKDPSDFDADQAKKGTILFIWGAFEKIMVANNLSLISTTVYQDYASFNSAYYILAAVSFSLYIYADFASYSDMARGIAKLLGIDVGKNFQNPYLSLTTSEFWTRWHTSLNNWFVEYVYIPLGGNRKGTARKYLNVLIVFFISGLWHGANYHFIAWGVINGILVIIGQILLPYKKKAYEKLGIDETLGSIRFCKRAIVFWLITLTWLFFYNGITESFYMMGQMVFPTLTTFCNPNLLSISGSVEGTFITFLCAIVFCIIQIMRLKESETYLRFSAQPGIFQCLLLALIICVCIFGACNTDTYVNSQFLYFQF